jgi:hypothetical protein
MKSNPDNFRLKELVLPHDHASAITFSVIGSAVLYSSRTHLFIINGMKASLSAKTEAEVKKTLAGYDVGIKGKLDLPTFMAVATKLGGQMGENRILTRSGRLWKGVNNAALGKFSAISFWCRSNKVDAENLAYTVIKTFGLEGTPVYVEAIDSRQPEIFKNTGSLTSSIDPSMSQDDIESILVKAHVSPYKLTAKEKEVALEFRGIAQQVLAKHGYQTTAEYHYHHRFSESLRTGRLADLINSKLVVE